MDWQPIETAPKDGSKIRVRLQNSNEAEIVWWDKDGDSWADDNGNACDAGMGTIQVTGHWACDSGGWLQPNEVSHFQLLSEISDRESK